MLKLTKQRLDLHIFVQICLNMLKFAQYTYIPLTLLQRLKDCSTAFSFFKNTFTFALSRSDLLTFAQR